MKFKLSFITPLGIHGASSVVDSLSLGKALRGGWRFWFRAMAGGVLDVDSSGSKVNRIFKEESDVFGSADPQIGARFKLTTSSVKDLRAVRDVYSHFPSLIPNSEFVITVMPRIQYGMGAKEDQRMMLLASSIWLWGNLGGLGSRSRRGYGSPILSGFETGFPATDNIQSWAELESALKGGLKQAWEIFSLYLTGKRASIPEDSVEPPQPFFILRSLAQVAVGETGYANLATVLASVCPKTGIPERDIELGSISPSRLASPVYMRMHRVQERLNPVITWCPHEISMTKSLARGWLDKIGVKHYLSGVAV